MNIKYLVNRLRTEPALMRSLAARALWHSHLSRFITIQRQGYCIRFHPSAVSAETFHLPTHLSAEERFIARTLKAGDTYIDVGANVGLLALRAASIVGPAGTVVAVEAHPQTYAYLTDNIRLNGFKVHAVNAAIGDRHGELRFSSGRLDDQNHVARSGEPGISVPMRPLDAIAPAGAIALLKVDVEGFELPVFRGATGMLRRVRVILFEAWDQHAIRYGYRVAEVAALLQRAGFTVERLSGLPLGDASAPVCENWVAHGSVAIT